MNTNLLTSPGRRQWLARGGATLAGALGAGSVGSLLLATPKARAADYRALVCIFLYGGNDGMSAIVPNDLATWNQYNGVRGALALPRTSLVPLAGIPFGLHPALAALAPAWNAGQLAPLFNVGPLWAPMTKAQYRAAPSNSPLIPDNLFSHSDQQILWETGTTSALERTGWGGRASAQMGTVNPVISLGGSARFGSSALQAALVLPGPGSVFGAYGLQPSDLQWEPNALRKAAIDRLYAQAQNTELADAYARAQVNAFTMSQRLGALVQVRPGDPAALGAIDTAFAPITANGNIATPLGAQLYQTAKLIAGNATVQGSRQIFFAQLGGFDTHGDQAITGTPTEGAQARLLKQLGDALAAFQRAMTNLGMADAVTTFTQSDFGRTFARNSSNGTDHAWGNQHLVLGGAVKGGRSYGTYPTLALGGPDDVGVESWELQGRWLPTTSVDQYAATLLGWFGASDAQLDAVLPNLRNFSTRQLGFL